MLIHGMAAEFCLRELLAQRGDMSQAELARRANLAFATVNRLATNATAQVSLETLDKIATVLGVEPGELIRRTPAKRIRRKA